MTSFDEPVRVVLGDPELLRQALLVAMERESQVVVRLEPQVPYVVETKGRFGRSRSEEVLIGPEIVWSSGRDGAGSFMVTMFHPPSWEPALVRPTPAGSRFTVEDETFYGFDLDAGASPAQAANEISAVTSLIFGARLGSAWQITVEELEAGGFLGTS